MTSRLFPSRTIRLACNSLWSRSIFAALTFGAIALALSLHGLYRLAAAIATLGAACAGAAVMAMIVERRFR